MQRSAFPILSGYDVTGEGRMREQARRTDSIFTPVAVVCGIAALATRPSGSLAALAVTVVVGAIGMFAAAPLREDQHTGGRAWFVLALALGLAVFIVARWLRPPVPLGPTTIFSLGASTLAALAEEIFFRRLVYGWLVGWGSWAAVAGSAVAFAAVHIPTYSLAAFPIDLAAGVVFGWQRWVTGGWAVPALTHIGANLLQFIR